MFLDDTRRCRTLIRRNDYPLSSGGNFSFDDQFENDTISISNSKYDHTEAKLANYEGFPLILGGFDNAKLEMLVTVEFPLGWIELQDYPNNVS